MLSKNHRLQKEKDIEKVLKKGKGFKQDFLALKTVKNELNGARFAFLVSKKISKKASFRNKLRRRLSELVRARIKRLKTGTDNLIIALPGIQEKDFPEIETNLEKLFLKAKIYG